MRKTKKTLAILAIVAMVLAMIPLQAFAATTGSSGRLGGTDRIDTAIKIADSGFTSASTVIVAPADDANLVDALAAAPLAGTSSPILLTYKSGLDPRVQAEITKLGAKTVDLVGAAANNAIANAISGATVVKLAGADRAATADMINAKLSNPAGTFVVGYDAIPDALSVASFAAANNYAIVLANPDGTVNASKLVGSKTYLVGGTGVVKDYAGATRLGGANRFATNAQVVAGLNYSYNNVYVANGLSLVDALVAAPVAAQSKAPVLLTDGSSVAANVGSSLTSSSKVVALGGTGAVSDSVVGSVAGGSTTPAPAGTVAVQSVVAASANSLKVTFSATPADTTKVTFTVTRNTTPITVTTAWDSTKTVATLTSSVNLPEGSYSIAVKNDTTDLGTSTVTISQQKIAQINITSDKLAVTSGGTGYATYQVLDQYGNDITTSYLTSTVSFQSGVTSGAGGAIDWTTNKGLIKLTPSTGMNLIQFSTVVITGYDSNTGVSVSKSLATSTALGTLSGIKLNSISSPTGAVLTAGDTSDTWYIDYSATDMSGNNTKNYALVHGGLILGSGAHLDELTSSSSYVTAKVVNDPSDSSKAAIQVSVNPGSIAMDIPVTITAMSYNGSTSTLNLTLKKAAITDTFTLMAPSFDIAVNETKQIPFVAYDQNGAQVTKYSDLSTASLSFSPSAQVALAENVDGTAKLMVGPFSTKGPQIITAMTQSGKISTLTLNIQDTAVASTLNIDNTKLINAMQRGAAEQVDFGYFGGKGGLSVLDQYGRSVDMIGKYNAPEAGKEYVVQASTSGSVSVAMTDRNGAATATGINGGGYITITAGLTAGQGAVTFKLYDTNDMTNALDTKTVTLTVLSDDDITNYSIDKVSTPIYAAYANGTTSGAVSVAPGNGRPSDYNANPYVYGLTSSGGKVMMKAGFITGVYTDNGNFMATQNGKYDGVKIYADGYSDPAKSSDTGNVTVTLTGADNKIHTVIAAVSSASAGPAAATLGLSVDERRAGVTVDSTGTTATVNLTTNATALATGTYVTRWKNDDGANITKAPIYVYAKDQYASKAMPLAIIQESGTAVDDGNFAVDANGQITTFNAAGIANGDYADITIVSTNGLQATFRISFVK